jgi:hypothetical protein
MHTHLLKFFFCFDSLCEEYDVSMSSFRNNYWVDELLNNCKSKQNRRFLVKMTTLKSQNNEFIDFLEEYLSIFVFLLFQMR